MNNILIADDDPVMLRLLSVALRKAGFGTFVAFDVVQATQLVRQQRIDAVILDMAMPGGTGADVIHRMKMSCRTIQVPVIVVSGSMPGDAREQALAMGADDFFPKPPDLEGLVASALRLLARRTPRPPDAWGSYQAPLRN